MVGQPVTVGRVGGREFGEFLRFARSLAEGFGGDGGLFQVFESLQHRAAETGHAADGRKIALGGNLLADDPVAKKFQTKPWDGPRLRQEFSEHAKAHVGVTIGQNAAQ